VSIFKDPRALSILMPWYIKVLPNTIYRGFV
jgi:hypothetical protein